MNNKQKKILIATAFVNISALAILIISSHITSDDGFIGQLLNDYLAFTMLSVLFCLFVASAPDKKKIETNKHERSEYWRNMRINYQKWSFIKDGI